jgi:hypothetical protein
MSAIREARDPSTPTYTLEDVETDMRQRRGNSGAA